MAINDFMRQGRRHKSSLTTDFDPAVEGQRLRDEPNRGNVEGIRELRSRPDPGTDAFLGKAARDAGFKGDVGFGDKEASGPAAMDQSWGVNPRNGAEDRFSGLKFGGTDFTARRPQQNNLPGPNTREGNMPPAGSGGRGSAEPFTANVAGRKTGEFVDKTVGGATRFALTGDPRRKEREPFVPSLYEKYQENIGRPFEDFARGLFGAGPVQPGGGSGNAGVSEAHAGTPAVQPSAENQQSNDPGAPATAFRSGQGHTGREYAGDVSQFLTDDKSNERARHDPMTGNPAQAFTGGADETGAGGYGAPGSSGTPGPGGTVNTISAEAFTRPGGRAAGDAAAGQAKRDFQLRQEGNAHLASDATPDEKTAARMDEIRRELNTINLGTNQSFSQLANNKARARRLEQELAGIQGGQSAAAERGFEAQQNQLDREAKLQEAVIDKTLGGGDLKVGSTMETIKRKMVNDGFESLTPEENFLMTERIREQAISDLSKENFGEPVTQDQIQKRMDLMLGQLQQAASQSSEAAGQSADNLAGTGQAPPMEGARQAPDGNWYVQKNGQWNLVEQ